VGLWIICRSPKSLDLFERRKDQQIWLQCQDTIYTEATGGGDITEARAAKLDHVLALCDEHVRYIESVYPFLTDKIVLSSNGIKADAIEALPVLERDPFRLIWASSPDRGLESTLKVFNRAREFEPRLSLHVYYGWDNIDKLIAQHGENGPWAREKAKIMALCGPGVVLHGRTPQRQLWRAYLESGLWVYCTAFTETSCISCMEAQALGAIPVFTPIWALAQNVGHGISIDGQNSDPLVQARYVAAILRLVRQPRLAESIRAEMMPWARQRFDWEHVVDQYEALAGVRQEALCS
jgi:glycosyltransferase involved in cell wall biosynthesis